MEELIRRGFRRIGFYFPTGQLGNSSADAHCQVFVDFCKKRPGIHSVLAPYNGESWDLSCAIRGAPQAFKEHPGVEAWIGLNDLSAVGLLRCLPHQSYSRVICFEGTILTRIWPGNPAYLDLRISEFARVVASVIAGKQDAKFLGQRMNWFRPYLVT